jgi:hypothetical protein
MTVGFVNLQSVIAEVIGNAWESRRYFDTQQGGSSLDHDQFRWYLLVGTCAARVFGMDLKVERLQYNDVSPKKHVKVSRYCFLVAV